MSTVFITERNPLPLTTWEQAAFSLGRERGLAARRDMIASDLLPSEFPVSPLSGEWAGESMPELFEQITGMSRTSLDHYLNDDIDAANDTYEAVLSIYESAYESSYLNDW